MTSNLRPEKRMDKNGRLVTKHVKDIDSPAIMRTLPAPAMTAASTPAKVVDVHDLSNEDLMDSIEESLAKASYTLSSDQRRYLVDNGAFGYSMRKALESMYTATKGIDANEAESLMSGATYFNIRKAEQGRNALEAAARAFPIARKVDAATFSSQHEYDERTRYEHYFGQFTKDFFGDSLADYSPDKDDIDELCSAYFLDRIGIEKSGFMGSTGSYYRALGKITSNREDIEPYLPILIASHLTDPGDYYTSVDDVIWYVESLKNTVPVDKVEVVAREFLSRRESSFDLAEEIVRNDSNVMMDGVL